MTAYARKIGDAVVAELKKGTFSLAFVPERKYAPDWKLGQLDTLRVTVVIGPIDDTMAARNVPQEDDEISIGVQQRVSAETNAVIDPLVDLVSEIKDFLRGRALADCPEARWVSSSVDPPYDLDQLKEDHQFTSVITLRYRVLRLT